MNALDFDFAAYLGKFELQIRLACPGRVLLVVGENGSGKSTLLKCLLGLVPLSEGYIEIQGERLSEHGRHLRAVNERKLGYVPQSGGLFPHMTVEEQLDFALGAREPDLQRRHRRIVVEQQLLAMGMTSFATANTGRLSGGQRQRLALGCALIQRPKALLLDEPFSSLDLEARSSVREVIYESIARLNIPVVLVSHDPADMLRFPDHIAWIEQGHSMHATSLSTLEAGLDALETSGPPAVQQLTLGAVLLRDGRVR